ncbi:hypothetical protein R1sor_002300 [Riccia sorocarpa]|uniref:Pentatricopeptide repeat-containing protein n=1 Tax=Riccia sorocarpa TaxID=122646 RepID=A0ABD3GZ82_9MARC
MRPLDRFSLLYSLIQTRADFRFLPFCDALLRVRRSRQPTSNLVDADRSYCDHARHGNRSLNQSVVNDCLARKLNLLLTGGWQLRMLRSASTWCASDAAESSTQTWLRECRLELQENQRVEENRVASSVDHSRVRGHKSNHQQLGQSPGQWTKIHGHGRDETVARICRVLAGKKWWGPDLISTLQRTELRLEPYIVNQVLKQQQRVQIATGFFQWAGEQKGYKHNTCVYNTMIGVVGSNKDFVAMKALMEAMLRDGCEPTSVTFTVIIKSFGAKKIDKAVDTFEHMREFGFPPDVATYNCLIDLLIKAGEDTKAWTYYQKLLDSGLEPDRITHNILYGSFVKNGRVDEACSLSKALLPVSRYNSLIHYLGRADKLEDAMKVFNNMQDKGRPDNFTYSSLITFFGKSGKIDAAWDLFQAMERSGCCPDVVVYSAIMSAFRKAGRADEVLQLFNEMKRQGCEPDRESYSDLIHSLVEAKRAGMALTFLDEMKGRGFEPKITTYSDVLRMLGQAGLVEEAYKIFDEMRETWRKPRVNAYHSMIVAFCLAGRMEEASKLLKECEEVGCLPLSDMYSTMIHGFCKVGDVESARELFLDMKSKGFFLDVLTCNVFMNSLCKVKQLDEALELLRSMVESGCSPNVITYTTVIRGCAETGLDELALSLFEEMKEKRCTPNLASRTDKHVVPLTTFQIAMVGCAAQSMRLTRVFEFPSTATLPASVPILEVFEDQRSS